MATEVRSVRHVTITVPIDAVTDLVTSILYTEQGAAVDVQARVLHALPADAQVFFESAEAEAVRCAEIAEKRRALL